jgi:hypothetical protein
LQGTLPALLAGVLISCGGDDGTSPTPEDPVFASDYLTTYTEVRALRTSNNHDGSASGVGAVRVHCNSSAAATAYVNRTYPLPDGCVLVKTEYADPGGTTLVGYTAMEKRAGFAPATGDWYWQQIDKDRKVIQSGAIAACISCHATDTDCIPTQGDYTRTCP